MKNFKSNKNGNLLDKDNIIKNHYINILINFFS